ncbi:hypothetical protein F5Y18DRAFT_417445 [Xylariaceae sp. FL1019]|nr:hypothetical protein F5Y18DRAFT_417445 [Xylariaceae sp. FL1019]
MPDERQLEQADPAVGDDTQRQDGPRRNGRRNRSLLFTDEEVAERRERELRFKIRKGLIQKEPEVEAPVQTTNSPTQDETPIGEKAQSESDRPRKPWETIAYGISLGENLSHIEEKDRQIEQERYIVEYCERQSPNQVECHKKLLSQLVEERAQMSENAENHMPRDQREKNTRIAERLDLLRWVLERSRCEDEKINVKAAIFGYESGEIPYTTNFTLIYGGCIVDTCPTYESFCEDRAERLERYAVDFGAGWLWHEPPLAGAQGSDAIAMKGIAFDKNVYLDRYGIGNYSVNLKFEIDRSKVSGGQPNGSALGMRKEGSSTPQAETRYQPHEDEWCVLETLLDSGASFPIIFDIDLPKLGVDLTQYSAQGAVNVAVVGGVVKMVFYEMFVSICDAHGESIVGKGNDAVWPTEPRLLGAWVPVLCQRPNGHRLSGQVPFDVCYLSSAPTRRQIWAGEDRRDVLGAARLPAHLRFDSDKTFQLTYPPEIEKLRQKAQTPDRVIFFHEYPELPNTVLTDKDPASVRGKSVLEVGRYTQVEDETTIKQIVMPTNSITIEPRKDFAHIYQATVKKDKKKKKQKEERKDQTVEG